MVRRHPFTGVYCRSSVLEQYQIHHPTYNYKYIGKYNTNTNVTSNTNGETSFSSIHHLSSSGQFWNNAVSFGRMQGAVPLSVIFQILIGQSLHRPASCCFYHLNISSLIGAGPVEAKVRNRGGSWLVRFPDPLGNLTRPWSAPKFTTIVSHWLTLTGSSWLILSRKWKWMQTVKNLLK